MQSHSTILTGTVSTPLGGMLAGATQQGICLLEFADSGRAEPELRRLEKRLGAAALAGESPLIGELQTQLDEYFNGRRRQFDLALVTVGTAFQERVWAGLLAIPYGETRSYRRLAQELGRANAVRAVGTANGDNPIAILIPCHRLIGSDGSLTGYGGGLWRKKKLLELEEGAIVPGR